MAKTLDELEAEVLDRSDNDRLHLLHALIDSLEPDPELERAWLEECRRRYADIRSGRVEMVSHKEVMAKLRARFG